MLQDVTPDYWITYDISWGLCKIWRCFPLRCLLSFFPYIYVLPFLLMSRRSMTLFVLGLQSLLLAKELTISWVICSVHIDVYTHTMKHAFAGQKGQEGLVIKAEHCWERSLYHKSCWLWSGQPSWTNQVHGWEASLQWCEGREWHSWIPYGNNSLSCICTTPCTVHLLCPGPTSAHDLPSTVALSVGSLPLYKITPS